MALHMSVAEYNARFAGGRTGRERVAAEKGRTQTKHHNVRVYVYADGFVSDQRDLPNHGAVAKKYDSKKEYNRACELALLQRAGKIQNLKEQVPMLISEAFVDRFGKNHRPVQYVADFTYTENGEDIVEDVKGQDRKTGKYQTTEAFRLKWKLLTAKYTDKVFKLY